MHATAFLRVKSTPYLLACLFVLGCLFGSRKDPSCFGGEGKIVSFVGIAVLSVDIVRLLLLFRLEAVNKTKWLGRLLY